MNKTSKTRNTLLFGTILLTLTIGLATQPAFAAEGDVVSVISCANANPGVGLAYDGTKLYYPLGLTSTTLGTCDTSGNVGADLPILGLANPISTVAYDVQRNLLWAATADLGGGSRDIYQINTSTGQATFMFPMISTSPGSLTDGLAYDGQDDTLWITGDVNSAVSHYQTDGTPIAIDAPVPGTGQLSGVAAGIDVLYFGHNGQTIITKHAKSDLSLLDTFNTGNARTEDLDCDPDTFPGIDVVWSKDAFSSNIEAFEVADGTCPLGGGGGGPVGGELLPIDTTALLLAGAQTNAVWLMSALAVIGSVAFGALYLTSKRD